ncbi:hypothetical protein BKA70DRAFT_1414236 [Coprinopsis sp. MPI-PUGE-AT-0042]|nr:hypothetical protein BKA70DRAFT_1414236 [Coprinopsis sp. MPI-PUGE-AT-0042]
MACALAVDFMARGTGSPAFADQRGQSTAQRHLCAKDAWRRVAENLRWRGTMSNRRGSLKDAEKDRGVRRRITQLAHGGPPHSSAARPVDRHEAQIRSHHAALTNLLPPLLPLPMLWGNPMCHPSSQGDPGTALRIRGIETRLTENTAGLRNEKKHPPSNHLQTVVSTSNPSDLSTSPPSSTSITLASSRNVPNQSLPTQECARSNKIPAFGSLAREGAAIESQPSMSSLTSIPPLHVGLADEERTVMSTLAAAQVYRGAPPHCCPTRGSTAVNDAALREADFESSGCQLEGLHLACIELSESATVMGVECDDNWSSCTRIDRKGSI